MQGSLIKEILDIIHDDSFAYQVDKLVEIDKKILGDKWDEVECAKSLDLSLPLTAPKRRETNLIKSVPLPKAKLPMKVYMDIFLDCYHRIKMVKYTLTKRDIGFLVHIIKLPMSPDELKKIVEFLVSSWENRTAKKLDFDTKRIIENLTPATIYNNINLLIAKSKETKSVAGWGYDFVKKKGDTK